MGTGDAALEPLSRTAGEGGERSEPGEGRASDEWYGSGPPSPSRPFGSGPSLSRGAGEGLSAALS
jgi:hypothetical protein